MFKHAHVNSVHLLNVYVILTKRTSIVTYPNIETVSIYIFYYYLHECMLTLLIE